MRTLQVIVAATLLTGITMLPILARPQNPSAKSVEGLMHTHEVFEFVANAPIDVAWPLFGAQRERDWAPGWDPVFLWPNEAIDRQGAVFKIAQGDKAAVWLTTSFDQAAKNRVQYVYVIPDVVATIITLKLTPSGASTHVTVTYERTALTAAANETVRKMAAHDRVSGPEWGQQINEFLRPSHKHIAHDSGRLAPQ
jgi:hypothetical protein